MVELQEENNKLQGELLCITDVFVLRRYSITLIVLTFKYDFNLNHHNLIIVSALVALIVLADNCDPLQCLLVFILLHSDMSNVTYSNISLTTTH